MELRQPSGTDINLIDGGNVTARLIQATDEIPGVHVQGSFARQVDKSKWQITASSIQSGEGEVHHAIDNNPRTFWHSKWQGGVDKPPHILEVDFGEAMELAGITILPRQDSPNGRVLRYELSLSDDGKTWKEDDERPDEE